MPITLRDFLSFPFNGGRGIRASQIADVDVPALHRSVSDVIAGRLGYRWYAAIRRVDHGFTGDDFVQLVNGARSDFPELTFPEFAAAETFLGALATPLNAPEALVEHALGRFLVYELTADSGLRRWWRVRSPVYILGDPYRFYVSPYFLSGPSQFSGATFKLTPRPALSSYDRYAVATDSAVFPDFGDSWSHSSSPVMRVDSFSGSRYVHLLLPHGTAPAPTSVTWAEDGAANIPVTRLSGLAMIDGVVFARYTADAQVSQPANVGRLVVLPERDGIGYWEQPFVFPSDDVGFTWHGGFFRIPTGFAPSNPVDALALADGDTVASTTHTITLPSDADGGDYNPDTGTYVAWVAQPQSAADVNGIHSAGPFSYGTLADFQTRAATELAGKWQRQPEAAEWNGAMYDVWLNNRPGGILTRGQSGQRLYVTRA